MSRQPAGEPAARDEGAAAERLPRAQAPQPAAEVQAPTLAEEGLAAEALAAPRRATGVLYWLRSFARNRLALAGAIVVAVLIVTAVFAGTLAPHDPYQPDYARLLQPPGPDALMGTDDLGRDLLSRVIYGARVSLQASFLSVVIAVLISVPIGLYSGYRRGWVDEVIVMRVTDALQAIPFLILALVMAAVLGPGLTNAMIAIAIGFMPGMVRLVRGQVIAESSQEYVQAARAIGAGDSRVMFRHILPNVMAPVLIQASLYMSEAIIAESSLSYLGLGTQPPQPSWGSMLKYAQGYLQTAPWTAIWPGVAIFLAVLAFNLLGDGLRDVMDPKLRRSA